MRRRSFLALAAGLAPIAGLSVQQAGQLRRLLQRNAYALDLETPLDLLTTYLTPNDLFFVRHHWVPTFPDPKSWRLTVDGEVATPLSLSLAELRRMPKASVTCVLQCAGNGRSLHSPGVAGVQWGLGAVGNAQWTGVRVKALLDRAGVQGSAKHLHSFGADAPPVSVPPFNRSLELEKALADAIVAYEMNGAPLPANHGAPARLVVPGWAGDHWMKWLTRLSASAEPQHGFFMDTAYRWPKAPGAPGVAFPPAEMDPVTELFVKATITDVPTQARPGAVVTVRGFAFSGAPDIAKVELSDDEGSTWSEATLDPRHEPYSWRLWSWRWTSKAAGKVTLLAKATDSRGAVQPRSPVWNQSGYLANGWHAVDVEVGAGSREPGADRSPLPAPGSRREPLPEGAGKEIAENSCLVCHSGDMLRQQRLTERQWTAGITKMKGWGAKVSEEETSRLLAYLVENFGPGNATFRPVATRPMGR